MRKVARFVAAGFFDRSLCLSDYGSGSYYTASASNHEAGRILPGSGSLLVKGYDTIGTAAYPTVCR